MKKNKLGEFEELVLLTVIGLQKGAYGVKKQVEAGKPVETIIMENIELLSMQSIILSQTPGYYWIHYLHLNFSILFPCC
jgi:hypothetical protein